MTWVCGPERVLVEEVVDHVRHTLSPADIDLVTLTAGEHKDREIWAAVNQYPAETGAKRLTIVRDAERIKKWEPLEDWLANARLMPTSYVLFVSNEHEFNDERLAHRAIVDKGGSMVRCNHLDEDAALEWLRRITPDLHIDVGLHLLERVGGDLRAAYDVLWKASLFSAGSPAKDVVTLLSQSSPADSFADALVAGKRDVAVQQLEELSPDEHLRTIGLLDSRLEALLILNRAARKGLGPREINANRLLNPFLTRILYPFAKSYDPATVDRRRALLTLVDGHAREGARVGVMESLCALW